MRTRPSRPLGPRDSIVLIVFAGLTLGNSTGRATDVLAGVMLGAALVSLQRYLQRYLLVVGGLAALVVAVMMWWELFATGPLETGGVLRAVFTSLIALTLIAFGAPGLRAADPVTDGASDDAGTDG